MATFPVNIAPANYKPVEPQAFYVQTIVLGPQLQNISRIYYTGTVPRAPYRIEQSWNYFWRMPPVVVGTQESRIYYTGTVPRAWPRIEQTWSLNLLETTLRPIVGLPPGEVIYDLPGRPFRADETWTWRQVGMLGQDLLPNNQDDWPLTPAPRRIDETWIWRQVGMLGQDQLLVGDQVTDLPPKAPPRLPFYSWEWRQVDKLGLDRLPVGNQISDLTAHRYISKPIEQTWLWRQVIMLGKDNLPENQYYWPLPQVNPWWASFRRWEWNQTPMLGMDILPENQYDWPLPGRPPRLDQTWTLSLQTTTLIPVFAVPFNQYSWPLTPAPGRIDETWTWRQTTMLGMDVLPENQYDWPLPGRSWRLDESWVWNQIRMLGQDTLPENQYDWPLPGRPWRLEQTWTLNLQTTTLAPFFVRPFFQTDWPLIPAARRIEETWVWNQTPMFGQDILPKNQFDWPLPGRPYRIDQAITWNQTPMFGQDRLPVGNQVYDLWIKPSKPIDQTWTWRQVQMLGRDTLPENQYDWPLPRVSPYWSSYRSWDWRQVLMLGQDQLPVGEQISDRPIPAPQRAVELYNWIQSVNLALTVAAGQIPFNQYDWPVPRAPQQGALGWTWRQLHMLGLDRLPENQTDWPLPNRGPAQFVRGWEWRQVDKLGRDKLPFGTTDTTLPQRLGPRDIYNWVQSVSLNLIPKVPFNQYDWPVPQPKDNREYLWTSTTYEPVPPEVLTGTIVRSSTDLPQRGPLDPYRSFHWNLTLTITPVPPLPITLHRRDTDLPNRGPSQPDRSFIFVSQFIPVPPAPPTGASYFLLQPHYINDVYLQAWTIVTEGREIPFGWVPTLMVDPLNAQAVAAFYAAGPRTGYPGPGYDWQGWQYFTHDRQSAIQSPTTYWISPSPGMFKLTGLGASLPPKGE